MVRESLRRGEELLELSTLVLRFEVRGSSDELASNEDGRDSALSSLVSEVRLPLSSLGHVVELEHLGVRGEGAEERLGLGAVGAVRLGEDDDVVVLDVLLDGAEEDRVGQQGLATYVSPLVLARSVGLAWGDGRVMGDSRFDGHGERCGVDGWGGLDRAREGRRNRTSSGSCEAGDGLVGAVEERNDHDSSDDEDATKGNRHGDVGIKTGSRGRVTKGSELIREGERSRGWPLQHCGHIYDSRSRAAI